MIKGTAAETVVPILQKISYGKRARVKEITLNLSPSMKLIARLCFPGAVQASDRFHIQKLMGKAIDDIRRKHRWEVIDQENTEMQPAKETGRKYKPDVLRNKDTPRQLMARRQYKAKSITPLAAGKKSIYTLNLQYYIKALARDANTGNITGGENGIYNHGETVNLTAIPAPGYEFKGWYESINGIWQSNLKKVSAIPHYEFSASKNIWLIAVFEESGYTVSLTSTTGGTNKGTGTYKKNTLCTLEAIPAKGYTFGGWYDENNKLLSKELTFSFTVMSDRHFSNNFIPNDNIITVWRDLYITVTAPKYKYKTGETCTLTATMYDKNYAFNGYYEDKECTRLITKSHIYSFIVDESRTIYTQNRDLTHFHFNRSFGFNHGMLDAATTLIENTHEYPAYTATLKAGEKVRFESTLEFIESPEDGDHHQNTTQITSKVLTIKQNGRVIATISKPDNYIFTAPTAGTYEFIYTGTSKCTIFRGEKCVGYFLLKAVLWKEETLN